MKTKYKDFLLENVQFNKSLVFNNIKRLSNWLYKSNGLNLNNIILEIFNEQGYTEKLPPEEIRKFYEGVDLLKKSNFKNLEAKLKEKLPHGIENIKNVRVGGKWHPVNKLNTNYADLAVMLTDIIEKMINSENKSIRNYILPIYNKIISGDTEEALTVLGKRLKSIINYYFVENGNGIQDFMKYTENIKINSEKGEKAELQTIEYLKDKGFDIKYHGGDGDFIDMIFGTDLIVYREDFGYKTIQVKAYETYKKYVDYYNVDWIAFPKDGQILVLDKQTFNEIIL